MEFVVITREQLNNELLAGLPEKSFLILCNKHNESEERVAKTIANIQEIVAQAVGQCMEKDAIWIWSAQEAANPDLSVLDLLLNENYSKGYICIGARLIQTCGYLNLRLKSGQVYEWLLRLAEGAKVCHFHSDEVEAYDLEEDGSFETDCYVASTYAGLLQQSGYFDAVVSQLIVAAQNSPDQQEKLMLLEQMLAKGDAYRKLLEGSSPVLLYYGVTYCYNILNEILKDFGSALKRQGVLIETYDEQAEDVAGLSRYYGRTFQAIIGVQSYLFSVFLKESNQYLHDNIYGPKYNFVFDHPVWLKHLFMQVPKDTYVLTHDRNYKQFIDTYYLKVSGSYVFPPAAVEVVCDEAKQQIADTNCPGMRGEKRIYDVSFIGTYGDYRSKLHQIRECRKEIQFLANRYLLQMRKYPEQTAEEAFKNVLADRGLVYDDACFLELLEAMRPVIQCVMYYYREKVIKTLLDAGIHVDIWGKESWEQWSGATHENLALHEAVTHEEALTIMAQSKLSLNIMAWHKGGFTERMADILMSGSVLVTDETTYFAKEDTGVVQFSLQDLNTLVTRVKELLADEQKRDEIAAEGINYARENHTWDIRAREFIQFINKQDKNNT